MCGDTPLKWLAKVTMGCAYPFSVSLLCVLFDGNGLGIEDYFAPNKRFYSERIDEEEAAEKSKWLLDLTGDDVSMLVNKDGVKWTWTPYFVLPGVMAHLRCLSSGKNSKNFAMTIFARKRWVVRLLL
jgi:hypothetical protein